MKDPEICGITYKDFLIRLEEGIQDLRAMGFPITVGEEA